MLSYPAGADPAQTSGEQTRAWLDRLRDAPDSAGLAGWRFEHGLRETVRSWGLTIYAPASAVARETRRKLRQGRYENTEAGLAVQVLRPDLPLIEVGAGIGVVSCFVNPWLTDPERHVAVEASRTAFDLLERNRVANRCKFEPVLGAVRAGLSEDDHVAWLPRMRKDGAGWSPADLADGGPDSIRLADLADQRGWSRVSVFLDAEGAELEVVTAEWDFFRDRVDALVVEVHPHRLGVFRPVELLAQIARAGLVHTALGGGCVFGFRRP